MGVSTLWPVLSELCERKPLTYLSGKYVAVDLSGWVVEATSCVGLNTSKNPHLRNLFYRVCRLLQLGVNPIFVTEGKAPNVKEASFKARNQDRFTGCSSSTSISRPFFDDTLRQCQDLLSCLGVPCVKSSGEAEAFCAFLCLNGVVNGVITEDSDAFLYGADVVYRDFSIKENDSHVNVYCLKSEKNKLQLDRKKLVALALLLGCDYSKGVPGIGRVNAVNLISELSYEDVLQRFKDWKNLSKSELFPGLEIGSVKKNSHCNRCGHLGSLTKHKKDGCSPCNSQVTCYLSKGDNPCSCQWHIMEEKKLKWKTELKIYDSVKRNCPDFPDDKVIDEYLNFTDSIPHDEELQWNCPNMEKFQENAYHNFGWSFEHSRTKVLPLITAWQQYKMRSHPCDKTNFIYEPVEILKEHNLRDITYYDVQWKVIKNDSHSSLASEDLVTKEYGEQFSSCYKGIVEEFNHAISVRKEERQANKKSKKFKDNEGNRKVKSKSKLHGLDIFDHQNIIPPRNSLNSDSFNGLLDIPLWERINIMSGVFADFGKSPMSNTVDSTNETVNLLFSNCSDFSELISSVSESSSNASLRLKSGENFKHTLSIFSDKDYSNFSELISSVSESSSNASLRVKSGENFKHTLSIFSDNKDCSVITEPLSEERKYIHHMDVKHSVNLNLTDSDDSFLSILLSQNKKMTCLNNIDQDVVQKEVSNMPATGPFELTINSSKQEVCNGNVDFLASFCSPERKMPDVSARLLYSVNQSTSTPKTNGCNNIFSSIFNVSTPYSRGSHISTPKSSKFLSNVIYSPLMLDSSSESA